MAKQPRKHHFIPQFYLAGFTTTGRRDGDLYVLDRKRRKQWKSTPEETAHKRDFHAVDLGGNVNRMVIEETLASAEGVWSQVVRSVVSTDSIPQGETVDKLMSFVAFMFVRVPQIRETLSTFTGKLLEHLIDAQLSTAEARASFRRRIEEQENRQLTDEEFEGLVNFGMSKQYTVNFNQTWYVQQMLWMGDRLAPILKQRKWCLWHVEDDAPDLICSDRPVAPTWLIPMPGPLPPAFGTPNTVVSIPLNRRLALVSLIEAEIGPLQLDREGVAVVNSMTALYANQFYSSEKDFVWSMKDGRVGQASDLLAALKEKQSGETERP